MDSSMAQWLERPVQDCIHAQVMATSALSVSLSPASDAPDLVNPLSWDEQASVKKSDKIKTSRI